MPILGLSLAIRLAAGAGGQLPIEVQTLEASNLAVAADLDAKASARAARDLASTLNYKFYRVLSTDRHFLAPGEASRFELPNHTEVTVTLLSSDPRDSIRFRLQTSQGARALDTEYSVRRGGTVFVSAGPSGPQAVLVLAITAAAR